MKNILDKLEPIAGVEFKYRKLGFFKYTRGSYKVYKDPTMVIIKKHEGRTGDNNSKVGNTNAYRFLHIKDK